MHRTFFFYLLVWNFRNTFAKLHHNVSNIFGGIHQPMANPIEQLNFGECRFDVHATGIPTAATIFLHAKHQQCHLFVWTFVLDAGYVIGQLI